MSNDLASASASVASVSTRQALASRRRQRPAAALRIEWGILAAGLAGAIPGGWLGARWTGVASERTLRLALGATLVVVGLAFAVQAVLEI